MSQSTHSTGDGHSPWWETDLSAPDPADATVVDLTARQRPETAPPGPLVSPGGGVTARGTFLVILVAALAGCLLGFVLNGMTVVPPLAGYGLVAGTVVATLICSPRLGWFPVWFPPVAFFLVVVTLGQVTLVGSGFSVTRELAMVMATLTAQAPAQLAAVVAALVILAGRRLLRSRR